MTNEGLNRIGKIILADIKHLSYKQDEEDRTKTIYKSEIKDNLIKLFFKFNRDEIGEFTNFKLLAQDNTIYETKDLSFKKANDEIIVEYPFQFVEGGLIETPEVPEETEDLKTSKDVEEALK